MSLQPSTWTAKNLSAYVVTTIVVLALAPLVIKAAHAALDVVSMFIPGMGK